jgi:hypothetical protein
MTWMISGHCFIKYWNYSWKKTHKSPMSLCTL